MDGERASKEPMLSARFYGGDDSDIIIHKLKLELFNNSYFTE